MGNLEWGIPGGRVDGMKKLIVYNTETGVIGRTFITTNFKGKNPTIQEILDIEEEISNEIGVNAYIINIMYMGS